MKLSHDRATTAGVHYVAFQLALRGLIPAMVRPGNRGIDLLAATPDGSRSIPFQIRSTVDARGRSPDMHDTLVFPLGSRQVDASAPSTIFCFVDLRVSANGERPDVYVLTGRQLRDEYASTPIRRYMTLRHVRPVEVMEQFRNNWQPLLALLGAADPPVELQPRPRPSQFPLRHERFALQPRP